MAGCTTDAGDSGVRLAGQHDSKGLRLTPHPAVDASVLTAVLEDRWIDPAHCRFRWVRNGSLIPDAQTQVLDPSQFARGDRIAVTVSFEEASTGETRELSAEVRVANSPPRVAHAGVRLKGESGVPELEATAECADPDGDEPVFTYRWYRNGQPIEGARDARVPASLLSRGDRVEVEVVARDDESESPPVRSEPFVFDNHPPEFTSRPVAPRDGDAEFRYQAVAVDPDGDPLRYQLERAPAGMTIRPDGRIEWTLPPAEQRHGGHPVSIRALDARGGEAVQEFTIRLDADPQATRR